MYDRKYVSCDKENTYEEYDNVYDEYDNKYAR